ncbi:MAG: glycerophosphodiester phosphodiesterase family protein [Candidatus Latescibacterota bacterium]
MIPPVRIAHRGASGEGLSPENTLAAFEQAVQLGVDVVEMDVHATADGHLVVIHDPTLDRTTDRQGAVRELTLEQVRQADAGLWRGEAFRGQRVPTLQEALEVTRHRALALIEIKADYVAERVLQVVAGAGAQDQVVLQSLNPQTVERVKLLEPGVPAALLLGRLTAAPSRLRARRLARHLLELRANALAIWHAALTPALFEEMRQRGISVWAWTVDQEIIMRDMACLGVQGIITNYPDRLNRVLDDLVRCGQLHPALGRPRRVLRNRWARRRQLRRRARH